MSQGNRGRFKNPIEAVMAGVRDKTSGQVLEGALRPEHRLEGKTCMVTGANSGVGFALAVHLARRGARVLMACRSGIPEAGEQVREAAVWPQVEMVEVDLSDLRSIERLTDTLKARNEQLDVVVCNAGVTHPRAKQTPQGLDEMFMVNYLAKVILLTRLLRDGTIPNDTFAGNGRRSEAGESLPRILLNSSDSHQGAAPIDFETFGRFQPKIGVKGAIGNYSYFKLILNTYGVELSRRLMREDGTPDVSVHCACPGPVNTNIGRNAPLPLRAFMKTIFTLFFQPPEKGARGLTYLATSPDIEGETGRYLHMLNPKEMDPKCYEPEVGRMLWERSMALWEKIR